ncbi:hypothetical protein [uncultured Roseobacter sp.]|uniref:hypothetical protein n=1 Tax=uncultured Roseobacter sp. TaxID=114847 RepID=UPI0026282259|nr:hypothetical protein [uncultured Roseobacter sp.]
MVVVEEVDGEDDVYREAVDRDTLLGLLYVLREGVEDVVVDIDDVYRDAAARDRLPVLGEVVDEGVSVVDEVKRDAEARDMLPEEDEEELELEPLPQNALRPEVGLRAASGLPTVITARSIPSSSAILLCISGDKEPPRTTRSPSLT